MKHATPVTGAFLAVAFADGRYESCEEQRFLGAVANHPSLACVRTEAMEQAYNTLLAEIEADFSTASDKIVAAIADIRGEPAVADAVLVAARAAIVADDRLTPQEERMLERIAEALGLGAGIA